MSASSLIAFAVALILAAGSPGPSVAALVARVLTRGFRSVLPFLLAMWIGEAVWLTVAVTGLAAVATRLGGLLTVLRLMGAAYLLFMAWRMWGASADAEPNEIPEKQTAWQTFVAGMMVTLGNPKIAVFYLALLPSLVELSRITLAAWAELTFLTVLILAAVDLTWAVAAARARQLLMSQRAVRIANRVSAGAMASAAVAIAVH